MLDDFELSRAKIYVKIYIKAFTKNQARLGIDIGTKGTHDTLTQNQHGLN